MIVVLLLFLIGIYDALCKPQMDWGSNPDLVNEFKPIQGRENYKLMTAMVGETIKLECGVAFAIKPAKNIVWEIDGEPQDREKTQTEDEDKSSGKLFIDDTFEITNITQEMDDKRVSCVYDEASVEAILHVFKLKIEIPEKVCENCDGDVDLLFKESLRSKTDEKNVDTRIKYKIAEITKINHNKDCDMDSNCTYSVTLPIANVKDNINIRNMNLELSCDLDTACQQQEMETETIEEVKETREEGKETREEEKETRNEENSEMKNGIVGASCLFILLVLVILFWVKKHQICQSKKMVSLQFGHRQNPPAKPTSKYQPAPQHNKYQTPSVV